MLHAFRDRSFRIPRPQRDRVDFRQLAALAAACLSVGVALSGTLHPSLSQRLHESEERDVDWQEGSATALAPQQTLETLHALLPTETSISAATSQPAAASAALTAADSSTPAKPTLQRGTVSYHCAANDQAAAKHSKCPRDRALEARVWRALSRLTSCSDAQAESLRGAVNAFGRAQLHLRFAPDAATNASFSAPAIAQSLNLRAVSRCVAGELSKLRAARNVDRFELEIGFGLTQRN